MFVIINEYKITFKFEIRYYRNKHLKNFTPGSFEMGQIPCERDLYLFLKTQFVFICEKITQQTNTFSPCFEDLQGESNPFLSHSVWTITPTGTQRCTFVKNRWFFVEYGNIQYTILVNNKVMMKFRLSCAGEEMPILNELLGD